MPRENRRRYHASVVRRKFEGIRNRAEKDPDDHSIDDTWLELTSYYSDPEP